MGREAQGPEQGGAQPRAQCRRGAGCGGGGWVGGARAWRVFNERVAIGRGFRGVLRGKGQVHTDA